MSIVHALKPSEPPAGDPAPAPLDPLRQELKDAIAARMGLVVRADTLLAAIRDAQGEAETAERVAANCREAVETAREILDPPRGRRPRARQDSEDQRPDGSRDP